MAGERTKMRHAESCEIRPLGVEQIPVASMMLLERLILPEHVGGTGDASRSRTYSRTEGAVVWAVERLEIEL